MKIRILAMLCLPAALTGCGTVSVKTAAEDNFRAENYHTFNFKTPAREFNSQYFSAKNQERVRAAIAEELGARGVREAENPDLWVGYFLQVNNREFDLEHPTVEGGSMAEIMKNHYGFVFGSGKTLNQQESIPYREGTLVVNLVDAKSNRVVWQGLATGAMHRKASDAAVEHRIREAIRKMFAGL